MTFLRAHGISITLAILLVFSGIIFFLKNQDIQNPPSQTQNRTENTLTLSGQTFIIEVASTPASQVKGLSGRPSLKEGTGLLFWFTRDDYYPFWMPDMLFSIDIVWIDKNWEVVHIEENVAPETYPNTFSSPALARYVLELPAGTVQKIKANVGQKVTLSKGKS